VDLTVPEGEMLALLGPNGSGKTTLFRIASTLLSPTSGWARVFGDDVVERPAAVRRHIGVVFQAPSLDKHLTVRENLELQARLYGLDAATRAKRLPELLGRLGVADRADDRVGALSGGLARRVDVARGLVHAPRLLLLDEPAAALDPRARRELMELLAAERDASGATIVMTTHLMEQAERADRVALLDHGRVVAEGSPDTLRAELERDVVRVRSRAAEALAAGILDRFGLASRLADGVLSIEHPRGEAFIPELIEAFRGQVEEVTLARPTLEDVFIRHTGHGLAGGDAEPGGGHAL
jgi:ABC-2 type transport system ATP-binding protein